MSRLPRLHAPGAFYHVTARGKHRNDIFFKHADRELLDDIMAHAVGRTGAQVHAYCWMTNHLHLLVQVADQPLGRFMQRVGTRFARAIQKELRTTGHLFENRYHALLVDADSYFLELLRYIHLNPVRARIVASPEQYRWSSHRVYLGKTTQSWVHTDFGLRLFASEETRARSLYKAFIEQRIDSEADVLDAHPLERRVLGDDAFLDKLSIPTRNRFPQRTLEDVVAEVCLTHDVSTTSLRSPKQHRPLSQARALIAARAIDEQIATLSEVARYLNRSASALSRALERYAGCSSK